LNVNRGTMNTTVWLRPVGGGGLTADQFGESALASEFAEYERAQHAMPCPAREVESNPSTNPVASCLGQCTSHNKIVLLRFA
jgi:hypothetical protein